MYHRSEYSNIRMSNLICIMYTGYTFNNSDINCVPPGSQALENQEVDDEKEDTKEEKREDKTAHDQNESKDSTACVEE